MTDKRQDSFPSVRFERFHARFNAIDDAIASTMHTFGHPILRYSLGLVFFWFGLLKPLGLSPVTELVANTAIVLPPHLFVPVVGWWEVVIGICLLYRPLIRLGILMLFILLPGTFLPLVVLPGTTWIAFPYAPTLEGQYIIKNLILIGAALVVGGTVRDT